LGSPVFATNATLSVTVPITSAAHQFYRATLLP
jgi:hypothetical protein